MAEVYDFMFYKLRKMMQEMINSTAENGYILAQMCYNQAELARNLK